MGRLIDVTSHLELDAGDLPEDGATFWRPFLGLASQPGIVIEGAGPREIRRYLSADVGNTNSLVSCIRRARTSAQHVRESLSSEMWEQINHMYFAFGIAEHNMEAAEEDAHEFYRSVREAAQFFQGLADTTLAHDEPWAFISLGTHLERADNVARLLSLESHLLDGVGVFRYISGRIVALVETRAMEGNQQRGIAPLWENQPGG